MAGRRLTAITTISIHAPHEGERLTPSGLVALALSFQSTLPTRGSDAETDAVLRLMDEISIHAPHEGERPIIAKRTIRANIQFQSTLPTRGSDWLLANRKMTHPLISIHAPHEGERQSLTSLMRA